MELKLNRPKYEAIKVGDTFSFERQIDEAALASFADLSGDRNPIHVDAAYARQAGFAGPVAHGMLLGSLFSTLIGMFCPGEYGLYLSQTLNFRRPVFAGSKVKIEGRITGKSDATRVVELETVIRNERGEVVVDGNAKAKFRDDA